MTGIDFKIRELLVDDAPGCDAVIASLPYFFGDPVGVSDCAAPFARARHRRGRRRWHDRRLLTLKEHFGREGGSAEITWMAVHASQRRGGLGRRLMDAVVERCASDGLRMLFVMTLGPSVPEDAADNYEGTRRFYRSMGFVPLRELGLRDWSDAAALVLARAL